MCDVCECIHIHSYCHLHFTINHFIKGHSLSFNSLWAGKQLIPACHEPVNITHRSRRKSVMDFSLKSEYRPTTTTGCGCTLLCDPIISAKLACATSRASSSSQRFAAELSTVIDRHYRSGGMLPAAGTCPPPAPFLTTFRTVTRLLFHLRACAKKKKKKSVTRQQRHMTKPSERVDEERKRERDRTTDRPQTDRSAHRRGNGPSRGES